ncbi:MAG: alpha/beta hydrolase [Sphingobacterium sp.]|uniref:alpha/beta hydrolase n=1 Tax=Sphingobacterium sp. JB170 TaxID=1434842 RepID=UPI00097ECE4E|nr:alpha/beta hydrolase-fold protein [Sphingobacterium sp. JB170]SJN36432.1 Putative esterase [Sphingobacterium sp. JB170]
MKIFSSNLLLIATAIPCLLNSCNYDDAPETKSSKSGSSFSLYAQAIQDSFEIIVQLPLSYGLQSSKIKYPVLYVTDADLYFPMLAPAVHQYEEIGLLPPVVLIGIGYGSIQKMDSLRTRDYLYPAAIPSDEMQAPGGGLEFYNFITKELIPIVDKRFSTGDHRLLLGHSFGGNFVLLAQQQQRKLGKKLFRGFVAASPALWYNDFYLQQQEKMLKETHPKIDLFLSVGKSEDKQWNIDPVLQYQKVLDSLGRDSLKLSTVVYPGLTHMETGLFSMLQGVIAHKFDGSK